MADLPLRAARGQALTAPLARQLTALGLALDEGAPLWRPRPFIAEPPWVATHPEIAAWCAALTEDQLSLMERSTLLDPSAPAILQTWYARLTALTALPRPADPPARSSHRVPSRKARQIAALAEHLPAGDARHVLDWCGGKGHLGRALGRALGLPVTVLDHQAAYALDAAALARRDGVQLDFVVADALAAPPTLFGPEVMAVGLHACGALGTALLRHAVQLGCAAVALAPCCLHKVVAAPGQSGFVPLSAHGRAHDPRFDHAALRLACADEVLARPSLRRQRHQETAYRLAFDQLARAAGRERYTPLGTLPASAFAQSFAAFAVATAHVSGIALPARWDPEAALAIGWREARRVRAQGFVRGLFRRAIEVWCALDRATFLAEHGFEVSVGCFAERAVTPRNILICARPITAPAGARR